MADLDYQAEKGHQFARGAQKCLALAEAYESKLGIMTISGTQLAEIYSVLAALLADGAQQAAQVVYARQGQDAPDSYADHIAANEQRMAELPAEIAVAEDTGQAAEVAEAESAKEAENIPATKGKAKKATAPA
jgi:hypothetical protein